MDNNKYNILIQHYQGLCLPNINHYTFTNNGYKSYNPNFFAVRNGVLENFENLTFNDIYTKEYKEDHYKQSPQFLSSELIQINENSINIHPAFPDILFYYIIYNLKNELDLFLKTLTQQLSINSFLFTEDKGIISIHIDDYKQYLRKNLLNTNNSMNMLLHFLERVDKNHIIYPGLDNNLEIKKNTLQKILEDLSNYDFSKINDL